MRACHTNNCPVGIATQKEHLRARLPGRRSVAAAQSLLACDRRTDAGAVHARAGTTTCRTLRSTTSRRSTSRCPNSPASNTEASGDGDASGLVWHRVASVDDLADGRVMTVTAGRTSLALTHFNGKWGALDNHCPHQGGPLGEGSIEKGCCGARGTATTTTRSPARHRPASPTRRRCIRSRCAAPTCSSGCRPRCDRARTVSDLMVDTMIEWGVTHVFGMVGHSNLGFADAMRIAEVRGDLTFIGIRHEGAAAFAASAYGKLTGRLGRVLRDRGPRLDQPAHRFVRRQGRPFAGARVERPGAVEGARTRRVPGPRPRARRSPTSRCRPKPCSATPITWSS